MTSRAGAWPLIRGKSECGEEHYSQGAVGSMAV